MSYGATRYKPPKSKLEEVIDDISRRLAKILRRLADVDRRLWTVAGIAFVGAAMFYIAVTDVNYSVPHPDVPDTAPLIVPDERVVPVFFATDRARSDLVDLIDYGTLRNSAETLSLGRIDVRIPEGHVTGRLERPSILTLNIVQERSHLVIRSAIQQTYQDFYSDLTSMVNASQRKEAFVFIHGYNVLFQDAVFRTAQIAWDLTFKGAAILYSWPSLGTEAGYPTDLTNNEDTIPRLQYFLEDVVRRSGANVIHLIAHSMGNRALVYALNRMVSDGRVGTGRFNQIVLAAPDMDASTFRKIAAGVTRSGQRTTLYASSEDYALKASAKYQGGFGRYRRAGDTRPNILMIDGIDTMDATLVDTSLLGHSYYGSSRSILTDIALLVTNNLSPDNRPGLRPSGKPPHWVFQK